MVLSPESRGEGKKETHLLMIDGGYHPLLHFRGRE
jgi:hypothetical protein